MKLYKNNLRLWKKYVLSMAAGDRSTQMRMKLFLPYYHNTECAGKSALSVSSPSASLKMVIFSAITSSRAWHAAFGDNMEQIKGIVKIHQYIRVSTNV